MEVGIMGLAVSGKSTVFGLLTGQEATPSRRDAAQVGDRGFVPGRSLEPVVQGELDRFLLGVAYLAGDQVNPGGEILV